MSTTITVRFQIGGHTAAQWAASNPVLLARELATETDTLKFKVGDGVTAWNSLPYSGASASLTNAALGGITDLSGGRLKFPATQVPSTDANTLDDYEEGTFTPTLLFGGLAIGMTFSTQLGRYTKIGRTVFYEIRMVLTAKGSSTGTATVGGLPFTAVAAPGALAVTQLNNVNALNTPSATVTAGSAAMGLSNFNGTGLAVLTDAAFNSNSVIVLTGFYTAA